MLRKITKKSIRYYFYEIIAAVRDFVAPAWIDPQVVICREIIGEPLPRGWEVKVSESHCPNCGDKEDIYTVSFREEVLFDSRIDACPCEHMTEYFFDAPYTYDDIYEEDENLPEETTADAVFGGDSMAMLAWNRGR